MKPVRLGTRVIGPGRPVYVIAEIGLNHNGSVDLAEQMIEAAARCGVDAVKFQTFNTAEFLAPDFPDFEQRRRHELNEEAHHRLLRRARDLGVDFLSTPLDAGSAALLERIGVPAFKVASGDLTHLPLLRRIAAAGKPVILSTGLATLAEIARAVDAVRAEGNDEVVLLQCTSQYPAAHDRMNLRVMRRLQAAFDVPVGLSDHSLDPDVVPVAAAALGACVVEKHFTLDRNLPGYDHHMSMTPDEMARMVRNIRATQVVMGLSEKGPTPEEQERLVRARRGLYWRRGGRAGQVVSAERLACLRPAAGLGPEWFDRVCGARLRRDVQPGAPVQLDDLEWSS